MRQPTLHAACRNWAGLLVFPVAVWWCLVAGWAWAAQEIVVGGDFDYPPYEYLDNQGNPTGYNVELTRAIAQEMGLSVTIRLGPWSQMRESLQIGSLDAIHGMFFSEERAKEVDFSTPHTYIFHSAFRRRNTAPVHDLTDLRGRTLIVMRGDIMHDYVVSQGLNSHLLLAQTQEQALTWLSHGNGDYALVAKLPGVFLLRQRDLDNIEPTGPPLLPSKYCYAVRKGQDAELLSAFNQGLAILYQNGRYAQIYDKWLGPLEQKSGLSRNSQLVLLVSLVLCLLTVGAVGFWTWSMHRQVDRRTAQLEAEVSRRMQAQTELAQSERRYHSLFADSRAVMLLLRPATGEILDANQAACEYYGYSRQTLLGMRIDQINTMGPEQIQAEMRLAAGNQRNYFLFRHRLASGEVREVEVYSGPINVAGEELLYSIVHDITERVRAQKEAASLEVQLRQAEKMQAVGTLAGGVAHDFNNILGVILGYAELAQASVDEGQLRDGRNEIQQVIQAAQRARDLVRQILTFSRQADHQPSPLDLNVVLTDAMAVLERALPKNVTLEARLAPDLDAINGDASQIGQVLINLASNAADAMPQGGHLTLETGNVILDQTHCQDQLDACPGPHVRLSVRDTGQGMSAEVSQRIFEPFFTTKPPGKGTGLGLSIVFGVVKRHQGHVTCHSRPGRGSRFDLFFPALPRTRAASREEEPMAQAHQGRGETILVVDDEAGLRQLASRNLSSRGYRVLEADSGESALALMEGEGRAVNLVLLDMNMPGMGGARALEAMRRLNPHLPVLVVSGYWEKDSAGDLARRGAGGFLAKPYARDELLAAVRQVLDQPPSA